MYFSKGINFTDIANLKKSDIKKDSFTYIRAKTKKSYTVYLFDVKRNIINQFKEAVENSSFVFPIIDERHFMAKKKKDRIKTILKRINEDLNSIVSEIGIEDKITTYAIRHSFATILKIQG